MLARGLTAYLGLTAHIRLAGHKVHLRHALQITKLALSQLLLLPAAVLADNLAMAQDTVPAELWAATAPDFINLNMLPWEMIHETAHCSFS